MNEQLTINHTDRGLTYGDGLFETIAYVNENLNHWELHWQRLKTGAQRLSLSLPDESFFIGQIKEVITCEQQRPTVAAENYVIKIIITRGEGGRGYLFPEVQKPTIIIKAHHWPERDDSDYHNGIRATLCETCLSSQPALAGIKHLNRLEQVLARNEFSNDMFQEGIMFACSEKVETDALQLIEGTSSNLFFVIGEKLFTPIIDRCGVQGTMKQAIINWSENNRISLEEGHYSLEQLEKASEVFFTNSIWGVLPVVSIKANNKLYWQGHSNKMSCQLASVFNKPINRPVTLLSHLSVN
ncbi:MAG: aminodeoxychorismate lyase [Gammaproteobacteria bacterium]|nr:aminodeoxychorismate lyase [Gammaproteobacteria bacterium]